MSKRVHKDHCYFTYYMDEPGSGWKERYVDYSTFKKARKGAKAFLRKFPDKHAVLIVKRTIKYEAVEEWGYWDK